MMLSEWKYSQTSGKLFKDDGKALIHVVTGYSGYGHGRNNHLMQHVRGIGPIPIGLYEIGKAFKHPRLGPVAMLLTPLLGTETFDRSEFFIHGNNKTNDASHGCVILPLENRLAIDAGSNRLLQVTQ